MSALRKNVASQVLTFNLVNATTGAALTGATVTVKVALDGTQSGGAGTVTELGTGQYKYVPTQGETNGTTVGVSFTATNAVPVNLHCFTTRQDTTAATVDANITAITAGIIAAGSFASSALDAVWSTSTRLLTAGTNIVLAKGVGVTGFNDIAASAIIDDATPFHGASIAAIKAKTDNLPASPSAVGSAMTLTAAYDAAKTASQAGDAMALTSGERTSTATAVWASATRSLTTFGTLVSDIWAAVADSSGVTTLLGRLTSTRAGLLDHLDADVSTRLATSGYTAPLSAAGTRSAVGLGSANLDTQLAAIAAFIDTEVAAIQAVTDQFVSSQGEPSSVPAANATPLEKIAWLAALARNKVVQTATEQTLKADDGSTTIATAAVSDDGTSFVRAEWS